MANLPADVTDAPRRLSKPLCCWGLVKKPNCVIAGEYDLFDGKLQSGHRYFPFAGPFVSSQTATKRYTSPTTATVRPSPPRLTMACVMVSPQKEKDSELSPQVHSHQGAEERTRTSTPLTGTRS